MPSPVRKDTRLRRLGLALAALLVLFGLLAASTREDPAQMTGVEKAVAVLLSPVTAVVDWSTGLVKESTAKVRETARIRAENAVLREQLRAAAGLDARNRLLEQENQRLQGELQLKEGAPYPLLTAEVIGRPADAWYRSLTINRGSRDGVRPNMAVVNWQGLVGKVLSTTPQTAVVQLITDDGPGTGAFGAGAILPGGDLGFVTTAKGGQIFLIPNVTQPAVERGQPVVTSGLGVLPPGLLIGYVESVASTPTALQNNIAVRPAADVHKLDVLHVVLYATEQDRNTGAP